MSYRVKEYNSCPVCHEDVVFVPGLDTYDEIDDDFYGDHYECSGCGWTSEEEN